MIVDRKYTHFPADKNFVLNPMQELLWPHKDADYNVLIIAKTSSGKSTAVPMYGHDIVSRGDAIIYVGSFKALAEEKFDDWLREGCPWQDLPKTSITGDYTYDKEKIKEIDDALLISITPESLLSVVRNQGTEKAKFLPKVRSLFLDEGHLVAEEGRGPNMEAAMVEFFTDYPDVRLIVMSGTIVNAEEYAEWMTRLNGRKTIIIRSDYRPVQLTWHFMGYEDGYKSHTERVRLRMLMELIHSQEKREQQFMVVNHNKAFGRKIADELKERGTPVVEHNADIRSLAERKAAERAFKDKSARVMDCTTTLGTGVNFPARNVVQTAVTAAAKDVPAFTVQQIGGRAGRPAYDTEGDVFCFVPCDDAFNTEDVTFVDRVDLSPADKAAWTEAFFETLEGYDQDFVRHVKRIITGEPINSWMRDKKVVATHFLGAVYLGRIKCFEDFNRWYHRTLAYVQGHSSEGTVTALLLGIVDDMRTRGMIKLTGDGEEIELRNRGKIAAQMMLDPYLFSDYLRNFNAYFAMANTNDVDIARAVGRVGAFYAKWMTREEKNALPEAITRSRIEPEFQKPCAAIYIALQGNPERNMPSALSKAYFDVKQDIDRVSAALVRACNESEMWKENGFDSSGARTKVSADERIKMLFMRVKHGLSWDDARKSMEGLRPSERKALAAVGLHDMYDVRGNIELAKQVLSPERIQELRMMRPSGTPFARSRGGDSEFGPARHRKAS